MKRPARGRRAGQLVAAEAWTGVVHAAPLVVRPVGKPRLGVWRAVCPVESTLTEVDAEVTCRRCLTWLTKRGLAVGDVTGG
ncbi:hypothetical protein Ppa06_57830 [Planomonospora parontospora subsp. parontospora]|uniref:Uncharacterized protein n=2 Tax=Planomonospora parontospora TaxID=58119 RepID=A0AA37BLR9_9ACTN|nr:hypothetical protein [Planomonospora parontospora]GGK90509.1 hypothetical protein GCM10010126_57480 [Planomonospora parontospora]GII11985.1 hypothetical protein Ppa06_57830 [Planomonospora parontospora subsp. parontospora]